MERSVNLNCQIMIDICRVKMLFYPATEATNLLVSSEHAFTLLKDNDFHYIPVRRDRQQPHGLTATNKTTDNCNGKTNTKQNCHFRFFSLFLLIIFSLPLDSQQIQNPKPALQLEYLRLADC